MRKLVMSPVSAITETDIPAAAQPRWQHVLDTYASEINKVHSVWSQFSEAEMAYYPHPKSTAVGEIMKHELLSGRRFFGEFLESPEPAPAEVLPSQNTPAAFSKRLVELAHPRLAFLAQRDDRWWLTTARFFDVERQRIWIFWRRILHTAHHRTQLSVYFRLLDKPVPAIYGPTADVSWEGADPTLTVEAASRGFSPQPVRAGVDKSPEQSETE